MPTKKTIAPKSSRPGFAPGYGIEKKITRDMLTFGDVAKAMTAARNYWVVTASKKGVPQTTPVWGLWLEGTVYFSSDPASRKGRNIAENPQAIVHLESGDEVLILKGRIERVTDAKLLTRFADTYNTKYKIRPDPTNPAFGFYRLRLQSALAWHEKDYPKSATRWSF